MITTIGTKTLLEHQEVALEWMIEKERESFKRTGGLLCDEMGLGKTLSIIALCINNPLEKTLILSPLAVVPQWISALKESNMTVYNFNGKTWVLCNKGTHDGQVFVSNTDKIAFNPSVFQGEMWDRIILDEAHQIRNSEGSRYKYIAALKRHATWCLSATPIVNKINDVAALLHLVNPRISPTKTKKNMILTYMKTYAMARSVAQVREKFDIFPKEAVTSVHAVDFINEEERTFYRAIQGALKEELMSKIAEHDKNMTAIFEILLRLRQLSLHPQIYIDAKKKKNGKMYTRPDWTGDSAKIRELVRLVNTGNEAHKWVIFCQFHDEIELIKERLKKEKNISHIWQYHGQMTIEQRMKVVEETHCPLGAKHQVLLLQIHCGGTGLNLQHMDRVVFTSPWWTAALMDQAVGRVMRIGQKKEVEIHHLKLKEGESMNIDDLIFSKVEMKRTLCNEVLAAANNSIELEADEAEAEDEDPI